MNSCEHLRKLSVRLLNSQEEERRRVAHEMQEKLMQAFVAVQYRVETALSQMKDEHSKCRETLEPVGSILQEGLDRARRMVGRMRPTTLDDLGVLVAVSRLFREVAAERPGLSIEKRMEVEEEDIPVALKMVIYRVLQGAFGVILDQASAGLVQISLERKGGRIRLTICGFGAGLDPEQILWKTVDGWSDSAAVGERVVLSGGSINVFSEKNAGAGLEVEWPLEMPLE